MFHHMTDFERALLSVRVLCLSKHANVIDGWPRGCTRLVLFSVHEAKITTSKKMFCINWSYKSKFAERTKWHENLPDVKKYGKISPALNSCIKLAGVYFKNGKINLDDFFACVCMFYLIIPGIFYTEGSFKSFIVF